ncbi:hypothetical protein GGI43DRAFT_419560 [Trichoderma evansii]
MQAGVRTFNRSPLPQRVNTWVELVPRLLAHLQIEHVALACHRAGTIYLLNTLIRCREILDPKRPLVVFIGMEHYELDDEAHKITRRQPHGSTQHIPKCGYADGAEPAR